jgi:hypothetical protein
MGRILVSLALGVPSIFVFILGAEPFEVRGGTSVGLSEVLAGCIALTAYLALAQFLVARKTERTLRADWPLAVAMAVPLLAEFFFVMAVEKHMVVLRQAIPMLLAGAIGILIGARLAHRERAETTTAPHKGLA